MTEHELLAPDAEPIHVQDLHKDENDEREFLCPVCVMVLSVKVALIPTSANCLIILVAAGLCVSVHDGAHRDKQVRHAWPF